MSVGIRGYFDQLRLFGCLGYLAVSRPGTPVYIQFRLIYIHTSGRSSPERPVFDTASVDTLYTDRCK